MTNMWPSAERPASGSFVRDQVRALEALPEVDLQLFAFPHGGGWPAYLRAARTLRRRFSGEHFDVVHAHYGLSGWSALAAPRPQARVVTYHGTDLHDGVVGPLSRALAALVDVPATVSAGLARDPAAGLRGAGVSRRVAILPCGADLDRFRRLDRREARRRLGLDPEGRYLLFPAAPARPEKRHDRARLVAEGLPGTELLTLGAVAPEDVPAMVNAANAVLVTSAREAFGLAAIEALACDVPVLSTDVGVAPVALSGLPGTLCAPFDRDTWLAAARPLVEADDPRVAGRARAKAFSSARMAERVAAAYRDVVEPR